MWLLCSYFRDTETELFPHAMEMGTYIIWISICVLSQHQHKLFLSSDFPFFLSPATIQLCNWGFFHNKKKYIIKNIQENIIVLCKGSGKTKSKPNKWTCSETGLQWRWMEVTNSLHFEAIRRICATTIQQYTSVWIRSQTPGVHMSLEDMDRQGEGQRS